MRKAGFTVAAAIALVVAGAAAAQSFGSGPLNVSADDFAADQNARTVSYSGRVEALQGQNRLRSDRLTAFYSGGGSSALGAGTAFGDLQRLEASGDVWFVTPTQIVRGDQAVYTPADDTLVVTGRVILRQGEDVLEGSRLVLQPSAGRSKLTATGQIRGVFSSGARRGG